MLGRSGGRLRRRGQRFHRRPHPVRMLLEHAAEADALRSPADVHLQALSRLIFTGGHDQRLHDRLTLTLVEGQKEAVEAAAVHRRYPSLRPVIPPPPPPLPPFHPPHT